MIYDVVKKMAEEKGISIYELEKRAGLTTGSAAKWNVSIPRADRLCKVADVLGCDVRELMKECVNTTEVKVEKDG